MAEANKTVVRRLVDEVFNGGHLEAIDELYVPALAGAAKRWITPFRASFPDVHSARPPRGVGSSGSMRSGSSGSARAGSCTSGRWRTPSTGCANWGSPRRRADLTMVGQGLASLAHWRLATW